MSQVLVVFYGNMTLRKIWSPRFVIAIMQDDSKLLIYGENDLYIYNMCYIGIITYFHSWRTRLNTCHARTLIFIAFLKVTLILYFYLVHHGLQMPPQVKNQVGWGLETSEATNPDHVNRYSDLQTAYPTARANSIPCVWRLLNHPVLLQLPGYTTRKPQPLNMSAFGPT
jgi:hypothetical protein